MNPRIFNFHGNSFTLAALALTTNANCKAYEFGIAIRSGNDQYSRKIGRNIAQGRLMCQRLGIKGKIILNLETPFIGENGTQFNWAEALDLLGKVAGPPEFSKFFNRLNFYAAAESWTYAIPAYEPEQSAGQAHLDNVVSGLAENQKIALH